MMPRVMRDSSSKSSTISSSRAGSAAGTTSVGVSLGSAATLRFRQRTGSSFRRFSLPVEPRSAYLLTGPARHEWEHSIAPGETLRMGCDLPAPKGRPLFDALLAEIDDGDLLSILERFGAYRAAEPHDAVGRLRGALARVLIFLRLHRPTFAGSAAADWADLDQRMRYIFCYFRSRQRIENLRRAPFSRRQVSALLAGRLPAGAL